ncbi:MAG: helicase HerA-like domain-containing protein [Candidatus Micrarchaeia archaeon]
MEEKTGIALGEADGRVAEIPYRYLTRHGVIAGSTGTGKSRAMQVLAEQLASDGVHVFVSDVKGDASGFCVPAFEQSEEPTEAETKWNQRNKLAPFEPSVMGANYWSVSDRFIPFRFSVGNVGSVLFSRLLSLNPTQESHLAIAFSYARKKGLPLDTPDQLLDVLDEIVDRGERGISKSSVSVIQRKIIGMADAGLGRMFGTPSLRLEDLGGLNVLNLSDVRTDMAVTMAPAFLLQKLFAVLPEAGDLPRPKFVIFFDEAHYLFKDANKSLRDSMVTMLKQIRSKGVAVFFVTQDVTDLPDEILSQLATKIVFSQKVFTEKGNARLRALSSSFPKSSVDVMETLKTLPPGVALLSTLDQAGNQTQPAEVTVFAPATTMSVVDDRTLMEATDQELVKKYSKAPPKKAKPQERKAGAVPIVQRTPSRPERTHQEQPLKAREAAAEKKAPRSDGPTLLDRALGGILSVLRFLIKAFGLIVVKPLRSAFRYLTKKPVRIIYLLIVLLILYVVIVNWGIVSAFLNALKIG